MEQETTVETNGRHRHRREPSMDCIISCNESSRSFSISDGGAPSEPKEEKIAKHETNTLLRLRLSVVLVLMAAAMGVGVAVYSSTKSSEDLKFKVQFENDAYKVMDAIGSTLAKTMGTFDSLSVTLISSSRALNQTWPFVTLPDFGVQMAKMLPSTKAMYLQVAPLVTAEKRFRWETFALSNQDWVNETIQVQKNWSFYFGPNIDTWNAHSVIFGDTGDLPYDLTRDFLPMWQNFPVVPTVLPPFNWDWLTMQSPQSVQTCIQKHKSVISEAYMMHDPELEGSEETQQTRATYYAEFIPANENVMEPVSDLFYPIIDEVDRIEVTNVKNYDPSEHKFVGVLTASIYWRALIKDILTDESYGLVIVFTNPCNSPFTYKINGPDVEYMGVGVLHDTGYENLGIHSELHEIMNSISRNASGYTGAPLDDQCPFSLHIYPSYDMEIVYTTNNPVVFTAAAILIFVFTSVVFMLYDCMVERRQKLVMNTAVRTSAIVSSLFPEAVRDRLYPVEAEEAEKKKGFRSEAAQNKLKKSESSANASLSDRPIAELYPNTTVLFCDIAGFTAWSANRQPWEVFHLLETIYGEFDKIARQRKVFKVETIGDCYVAVVGLPTPRKNHATVMARFASDCRAKMNEVTVELEEQLGEGTTNLALRFGLNSGPTTAGVLRGEKGRFQLFGDTVNTAARMESNSERNRIQVSQSTADLLIADGKRHWLTPRKDLVNAKGKGLMQTYWCEPKSRSSSAKESSADSLADTNYDIADCENASNTIRDIEEALFRTTGSISNFESSTATHGRLPTNSSFSEKFPKDEIEDDIGVSHDIEEAICKAACSISQHQPSHGDNRDEYFGVGEDMAFPQVKEG